MVYVIFFLVTDHISYYFQSDFSNILSNSLLTPIGGFQIIAIPNKEDAFNLGVTRSVLRASGVRYDVNEPGLYDIYNEIYFKVQYVKSGDSLARAWFLLCSVMRHGTS